MGDSITAETTRKQLMMLLVGAGVQVTGSEGNRSQAAIERAPSWVNAGVSQRVRNVRAVSLMDGR